MQVGDVLSGEAAIDIPNGVMVWTLTSMLRSLHMLKLPPVSINSPEVSMSTTLVVAEIVLSRGAW